MNRAVFGKLKKWKMDKNKKPLVVRGVRQVGKTWLVEEFSKEFETYVKIDFEKQTEYKQLFETTKDPQRLIENISLVTGIKIDDKTLIFFDEIQCCSDALNSLKYFCEDAPQYNVVCAGSLLGIQLAKGFPVGKVDFLDVLPMTFEEFLDADNSANLLSYIKGIDTINQIPSLFSGPLSEKLAIYMFIGGMPEVVKCWRDTHDINKCCKIIDNILEAYRSDFGKYAPNIDMPKINLIWDSLTSQLSKENKKFLYKVVKEGARAREYENSLNWLCDASLLSKVYKVKKPNFPLSAYVDRLAFKIYMSDVGLLRQHANIPYNILINKSNLFTEFRGSLTENYILQCLQSVYNQPTYYWSNNNYEVDFVLQNEDQIIPIEVKAGNNVASTSLKNYIKLHEKETQLAVRFSTNNLSLDGKILNIPLYLAEELPHILKLVIK